MTLLSCLLLMGLGVSCSGANVNRGEIDRLWKEYDKAVENDLPQTTVSVLKKLKTKAKSKGLNYDYYLASIREVSAESSRNWKLRDSLTAAMNEEFTSYGDPVILFSAGIGYNSSDASSAADFLSKWEKKLRSSRSTDFWKDLPVGFKGKVLLGHISNDYDYLLLKMALSESLYNSKDYAKIEALLKKNFASDGGYPVLALQELWALTRGYGSDYSAYIKKYEGRATATLAKLYSLSSRFSDLEAKGAKSEEYRELKASCEALLKEQKAYSGEEALILEGEDAAKDMIETLESSSLSAEVKGNEITVSLRNLPGVTVSLYKGEDLEAEKLTKKDVPVFTETLENGVRSFYAPDTLRTTLPELSDGEYLAVFSAKNPGASAAEKLAGKDKIQQSCSLSRHSLALSMNRSSEGWLLYAAERLSGRPVGKVRLSISSWNDAALLEKDINLCGATLLDSEVQKVISEAKGRCNIVCSLSDSKGLERNSETLRLYSYSTSASTEKISAQALLLTDRSAYRPGETLHFKAVLYKDFRTGRMETLPQGQSVAARLLDAEGNEVGTLPLSTNEFGSVAGEFSLPSGRRNGTWRICIEYNGSTLNAKWFTLDEFVLPEFSVEFSSDRVKYFPGQTVPVSGQVVSYAGNSLGDASAEYTVKSWDKTLQSGALSLDDEGRFSIPVATSSDWWSQYTVTIKITDGAGQSLEFSKWVRVSEDFSVEAELSEKAEGSFSLGDDDPAVGFYYWRQSSRSESAILKGDTATFTVRLSDDGKEFDGDVQWTLYAGALDDSGESAPAKDASANGENSISTKASAKALRSGKVGSGKTLSLDFSALASGLYSVGFTKTLEYTTSDGKTHSVERKFTYSLLKLSEGDTVLGAEVENAFRVIDSEGQIGVLFGAGRGPVWANALLFDLNGKLLKNERVELGGVAGKSGSLRKLAWDYSSQWSDKVLLRIEYFKDGRYRSFDHEFARSENSYCLPLSVSTFSSSCLPGTQYTVRVTSQKASEILAAVFDKSSEDIRPNSWSAVRPQMRSINVSSETAEGCDFSSRAGYLNYGLASPIKARLSKSANVATASLMSTDSAEDMVVMNSSVALESAPGSASSEEEESSQTVKVRQDFQTTLSFQPFIRTAEDGTAEVTFTTSDRLSTYILALFAHDKEFRNATSRSEFTVSQPVTITVHEPSLLYGGDRYAFRPSISNNSDKAVSGTLTVYIYDGDADLYNERAQAVLVQSCPLTLEAGKAVTKEFSIYAPEAENMQSYSRGKATLSFKAVFRGSNSKGTALSDALLVRVPVLEGKQRLTEAHSALYRDGMDKNALIESLKKQFVNTTAFGAIQKEVSISEMLDEVLAGKTEISSKNVLTLSEVLYVRAVCGEGDTMECVDALLECRNADGGFGWFSGMSSSAALTAVVLERLALLRTEGLLPRGADWVSVFHDAVQYIDTQMFTSRDGRHWYCGISTGEYLYLRSLFPGIAVDTDSLKTRVGKESYKKTLKEIKSYVQESGKNDAIASGQILEKARRSLAILNILSGSSDKFDSSLGLKCRKMKKTLSRSIETLKQYAVEHPSGGFYYPNAVMPFRALLSSEAYAHAMISNLFTQWNEYLSSTGNKTDERAATIADGVRLWLMVQKETQEWEKNFEFVNAVNAVRRGSESLLKTTVISLSKTYEKPFEAIKAAGNGFSIERRFFVEELTPSTLKGEEGVKTASRRELRSGETLKVGDKVIAVYSIRSDENRSLVHLRTPLNACLRPVRQLSGSYGYALLGWRVNSALDGCRAWWITPQGYREVHSGSIDYWFDVYPEEKTTVEDTFYVSQEGVFTAPVSEIESLYAPHYRANAAYNGVLTVTE